jgi:hypothetical protein
MTAWTITKMDADLLDQVAMLIALHQKRGFRRTGKGFRRTGKWENVVLTARELSHPRGVCLHGETA